MFHDTPRTPPSLHSVHQAVESAWHQQDRLGRNRSPYYWVADRHTTSRDQRWRIATRWWARAKRLYHTQPAATSGVPSWFYSAASCLSDHEEYGFDGPNTIAGYLGFVFAPSQYQEPGPTLAATYGDSWLSIPLSGQLSMAWSLYQSYGFSPWTTASACGL